ncbi:cupin domain-containing protein [Rhodanobacter sp. MP1X3]|jgi:mannose-6-phosphate isomerase-like protein (cupin superfamily)|uniref:cupin domain-containing protein n=1 Tax=Rhodanobacter sp. MP1X3 TaxID=2723086 RepID=UPI00161F2E29|nr:cupin domain-containing protein [Rhodanobacter sp. MP1X3]MBB6244090.1 mannose-6-phosphate isomerase-like protein (cupin superfamily) [Rhodanobacter sp. MP1X3]
MNASVSTDNAAHYRWGGVCDGWHLLAGDDLSVIEERMPPGAAEVRHRHARARQFFYVLEGVATLEATGVTHTLKAGQGLHISPGTAHQMRNECAADLRFMVISAPKSHGDRELAPLDEVG